MKRFLVFAYDAYYPVGGWNDFVSDHDTAEEAQATAASVPSPLRQIIDTVTGRDLLDVQVEPARIDTFPLGG